MLVSVRIGDTQFVLVVVGPGPTQFQIQVMFGDLADVLVATDGAMKIAMTAVMRRILLVLMPWIDHSPIYTPSR